MAQVLKDLGIAYVKRDPVQAEGIFRECLALRESLPENSEYYWERVADAKRELARALRSQKGGDLTKLEDAERMVQECLEIRYQLHGAESVSIASTYHELARIQEFQAKKLAPRARARKARMAQENYRTGLEIIRKLYGDDACSSLTAASLKGLSNVLHVEGKYEEALEVNEECLKVNLQLYQGRDMTDVKVAKKFLLKRCKELYRDADAFRRKVQEIESRLQTTLEVEADEADDPFLAQQGPLPNGQEQVFEDSEPQAGQHGSGGCGYGDAQGVTPSLPNSHGKGKGKGRVVQDLEPQPPQPQRHNGYAGSGSGDAGGVGSRARASKADKDDDWRGGSMAAHPAARYTASSSSGRGREEWRGRENSYQGGRGGSGGGWQADEWNQGWSSGYQGAETWQEERQWADNGGWNGRGAGASWGKSGKGREGKGYGKS